MTPESPRLPVKPHEGVRALLSGLRMLLREPTVRRPAWWGVVVHAVAFLILVDGLLFVTFWATADMVDGTWVLAALAWVMRISAIVAIAIMAPVLYGFVGAIVMPTLKGRVFMHARRAAGGPRVPGGMGLMRSIHVEVRRLSRFVGFTAALAPLNLVPLWGTAAFALGELVVASHTLGWDLLAYHFELHDYPYRAQREALRANRALVMAVGLAGVLMNLVPVVHALFVTSHVAGAGVISALADARAAQAQASDVQGRQGSRLPRAGRRP